MGQRIPLASPILQRRLREGRRRLLDRWPHDRKSSRFSWQHQTCPLRYWAPSQRLLGPKSLPWQHLTHPTRYTWASIGSPTGSWQTCTSPSSTAHRGFQLRHHQQPRRGGRSEPLRLSHFLVNSALDRLANVRDQIVIEGTRATGKGCSRTGVAGSGRVFLLSTVIPAAAGIQSPDYVPRRLCQLRRAEWTGWRPN